MNYENTGFQHLICQQVGHLKDSIPQAQAHPKRKKGHKKTQKDVNHFSNNCQMMNMNKMQKNIRLRIQRNLPMNTLGWEGNEETS